MLFLLNSSSRWSGDPRSTELDSRTMSKKIANGGEREGEKCEIV